jgi:DNA repair and recombination RAD54-like protein
MLPAKKRVLLSGTPMQNELTEFYNMVNFCNPNVLGTPSEFRRKYERPILASREPDASPSEVHVANLLQKELSTIVNEFILKRGNILNAQHLPPKLVQFVCCQLSPLQDAMYDKLLNSKECQHILDGRNNNALNTIRHMINICSHPDMIVASHEAKVKAREYDETLADLAKMVIAYKEGDDAGQFATPHTNASSPSKKPLLDASGRIAPFSRSDRAISRGSNQIDFPGKLNKRFRPELSGKFYVLYRLMETMRAMRQNDRIVIVSNYTSTLDLVEQMCEQNNWPKLRLDGTVTSSKRTKLVDTFNDPTSGAFAFLLSSKAGGCGINLIGGNRLVLFDPDWNPASDKQAAARIWREGQKKRCFIYRFMSTSTIEEKIIQRQLSKEGLVSIVDNKEQVNQFSSKELKALFRRRKDTRSDTHDTLRCTRCSFVKPLALPSSAGDTKAVDALPKAVVDKCVSFLTEFQTYLLNAVQTANIVEFDFRALDMVSFCIQMHLLCNSLA